jgi:prepilin-type N-terminal cleavage/methylation domain-containing protein
MKFFGKQAKQKGFTLIELLVAMTIIGILATIGLRSFSGAQLKSRDAKRKNDLASMQKALELYYNDFGQYPQSAGGSIVGCGDDGDPVSAHGACTWGGQFAVGDIVYMQELPIDPKGSYFYYEPSSGTGGASYYLLARLENLDDAGVARNGSDPTPMAYNVFGGTSSVCRTGGLSKCNYVVTSSNAGENDLTKTADN